MREVVLSFDEEGGVSCLWTDELPLRELGVLDVQRASSIEFNPATCEWDVRWTGSDEVVYSDPDREACITWEHEKFNAKLALPA